MLSKKEKEELLEDGRNSKRREEFALDKRIDLNSSRSLDEFIQFLVGIQRIFSPFAPLEKIPRKRVVKKLIL